MPIRYRHFSGRSLDRLAALSDGIFAITLTLLVLDLHVPALVGEVTDRRLWDALAALGPHLLAYLVGFLALGMFWVGQQTQFNHLGSCDRHYTWIQLGFLACVSVMPFTTALLAEYPQVRVALLIYWVNLLLLGVALFGAWRYAGRAGLRNEESSAEMSRTYERRIVVVQILYAACVALCVVSTTLSIVLILLLQLNSALSLFDRF
jgi:uncharacterized membrane protein